MYCTSPQPKIASQTLANRCCPQQEDQVLLSWFYRWGKETEEHLGESMTIFSEQFEISMPSFLTIVSSILQLLCPKHKYWHFQQQLQMLSISASVTPGSQWFPHKIKQPPVENLSLFPPSSSPFSLPPSPLLPPMKWLLSAQLYCREKEKNPNFSKVALNPGAWSHLHHEITSFFSLQFSTLFIMLPPSPLIDATLSSLPREQRNKSASEKVIFDHLIKKYILMD